MSDYVRVQKTALVNCLTCPLCTNVFRDATTICACLHTFCEACIYQKLKDEKTNYCPVCQAYLGSFPEELLRPDNNLRQLIMQVFPLESPTRGEEGTASSPVNKNNPDIAGPSAPEAKSLHHDSGGLQETRNTHEDKEVAENLLHLTADKKQAQLLKEQETEMAQNASTTLKRIAHGRSPRRRNDGLNWGYMSSREEDKTYKTKSHLAPCNSEAEGSLQMKKRQKIKRTTRDSVSKQRSNDATIISKEVSKSGPSAFQRPVWFCLQAWEEKNEIALPQISSPYLRIKDGDFTVSSISKHLANKLNLKHESEVEVMCFGETLDPTLTLKSLIDIWVEAVSDMGHAFLGRIGDKTDNSNSVMELTYRRSNNHEASG